MLVFTCDSNTIIEIGENIKVRVVSIRENDIDLEIDAPGDICLADEESDRESSSRESSRDGLIAVTS